MTISNELKEMTSLFTLWGIGVGGAAELLETPKADCLLRTPIARVREVIKMRSQTLRSLRNRQSCLRK